MDRSARLDDSLVRLMGQSDDVREVATSGDAFSTALESFDRVCLGRYGVDSADSTSAARLAGLALSTARDPDALGLARAAAGLVIASWTVAAVDPALRDPVTGGDPLLAARVEMNDLSLEFGGVIRSLLAEACLACARVALAAEFLAVDGTPPETLFGRAHPYLTFMRILHMRVAAFAGNISAAEKFLDAADAGASTEEESLFALAGSALVLGNADRRKDVRLLIAKVLASAVTPVGAIGTGCYALAAYGAVALGDLDRAAQLVLVGGGDPNLSGFRIIDRALGLEMLVAVAVEAGDADAADAWSARAEALAAHPISAPTVKRIESRIALLKGDVERAVIAAQRAIDRAVEDGRGIEAAEGEILLARAHLVGDLRGQGARQLAKVTDSARQRGHLAVQRAASKELRRVGRRLPPQLSSGWEGLSARERDVARMLANGGSNALIAAELFLSIHTVRIHVSRVLQAFGVATRAGVAAALAPDWPASGSVPAELTQRQRQIVACLVTGASNAQIAAELGIGVTTVEKHVGAVLQRWEARSRAEIVHIAMSSPQ